MSLGERRRWPCSVAKSICGLTLTIHTSSGCSGLAMSAHPFSYVNTRQMERW
uniref:Uncharacterized protein n=1 Tax=Phytophthora fragariae TaxID=53985 RepID=A0A6A3FWU3_9STRA|nr:hypothetical protein PF009_g736 [Phytophthora fragariae]